MDIVEQLRAEAEATAGTYDPALLRRAADEIERLGNGNALLRAANELLNGSLLQMRLDVPDPGVLLRDKRAAEREVSQLREALTVARRMAVQTVNHHGRFNGYHCACNDPNCPIDMAFAWVADWKEQE